MTKEFIVYVLNTKTLEVGVSRYAKVDEADTAARNVRDACRDRGKYLITVCHEDCGLLGTF